MRSSLWEAILQPEDSTDGLETFRDAPEDDDEGGGEAAGAEEGVRQGTPDAGAKGSLKEERRKALDKLGMHLAGLGQSADDAADDDEAVEDSDSGSDEGADNHADRSSAREARAGQAPPTPVRAGAAYDMRKREPEYAHAERSAWWELSVLAGHIHPSVAAMARTLLSGTPIVYAGNPLQDMALTAFLDKFIQKKAKVVGQDTLRSSHWRHFVQSIAAHFPVHRFYLRA